MIEVERERRRWNMGVYLNPGNEKFAKAVQSEIYVDKTGLIEYTNQVINADGLLWEGMRFQRTFFWIENFSKCCICTALKSISYDFFEYAGISEPEQGNWPGD